MCTILGYGLPGRETYCMLSVGEAFVFLRFSTFSSLARFPLLTHRGINYPPTYVGPPFLSRKELRFANFLFVSICILSFYKRIVRFVPAIPLDCTVPRIRSGFLPTCGALQGFTPTREWQSHSCRQQTKFAALRYVQEGFFAMEQDLRLDRPKLVSDPHHIQIHRLRQIIHIGIFYHWLFLCGFTFHLFFF